MSRNRQLLTFFGHQQMPPMNVGLVWCQEITMIVPTTPKEGVHPGTTALTTHASHPGTQVELLTTLNVKTVLATDIRATQA